MEFTAEQQEYLDQILNDTHVYYEQKMQKVFDQNKQLRRANSKQKKEIRELRRVIHKKKQQENKQHYKNGKRGTIKNGG